jgi:hypothetical protein
MGKSLQQAEWADPENATVESNERLPMNRMETSSPQLSPPQACGGEGEEKSGGSGVADG